MSLPLNKKCISPPLVYHEVSIEDSLKSAREKIDKLCPCDKCGMTPQLLHNYLDMMELISKGCVIL